MPRRADRETLSALRAWARLALKMAWKPRKAKSPFLENPSWMPGVSNMSSTLAAMLSMLSLASTGMSLFGTRNVGHHLPETLSKRMRLSVPSAN
eukprot:2986705-Pyramimonas_sp.AAC.1